MTMPAETRRRYTVEEYFRLEREAEERHEFRDGEIIAMSGGTNNHSLIAANTIVAVGYRLRGTPCRVYESNLRVRIKRRSLYTYPDISMICQKPEIDPDDPYGETVLDPRLVIEVLSPSTELYNRTKKFERYRENASFQEYLLISQEGPQVETYFRHPDGSWRLEVKSGLSEIIRLRSIGIELPLSEVYDRVAFPPPAPEPGDIPPLPPSAPAR